MSSPENLAIVGGAAAGYTAAIYAARAALKPVVFVGDLDGGQLSQTSEVENFPGFPDGIMGAELMQRFRAQAEKFGARMQSKLIKAVSFESRPFKLEAGDGEITLAHCVIVATGASARWLGLASEQRLRGKGVSACATCDGFFFRDKEVAVVGGGDSAMEEAVFLTKFASKVTIIHRREELRAGSFMQGHARKNPKITFLLGAVVEEVLGKDRVEGLRLRKVKTGEAIELSCQGLFLAVGHEPNTKLFRGKLELDAQGYIMCRGQTETSVPGVFAAGDVRDPRYRQAVSAAGTGCMAAIDAERFLGELGAQ